MMVLVILHCNYKCSIHHHSQSVVVDVGDDGGFESNDVALAEIDVCSLV